MSSTATPTTATPAPAPAPASAPATSTSTSTAVSTTTSSNKDSCPQGQTNMISTPNATAQPRDCPLEYINVTQTDNEIKVVAKGRASSAPEDPRVFSGANRYQDYDTFWSFMKTNLNNFDRCKDPLDSDPNRFQSKPALASVAPNLPPSTVDEILAEDNSDYDWAPEEQGHANLWRLANLLLRYVILFGIVYLMITYIPQMPLDNSTKLLIGVTVVLLYGLIDFMGQLVLGFQTNGVA